MKTNSISYQVFIWLILIASTAAGSYFVSHQISELNEGIVGLQASIEANSVKNSGRVTYVDKDLGFSFTMPANFTVLRETLYEGGPGTKLQIGQKISDFISENTLIRITVLEDDNRSPAQMKADADEPDIIETSSMTIDGQPAIKDDISGLCGATKIYSSNGQYSVLFWWPCSILYSPLLDDMAASFNFPK